MATKNKNKEECLKILAELYEYLPIYYEQISETKSYLYLLLAKSNIFNASAILDSNNWEEVLKYVQLAIDNYSLLLNDIEIEEGKTQIERGYVMINELKNAVNLENKEIFLLKYKYIIREFNNIK